MQKRIVAIIFLSITTLFVLSIGIYKFMDVPANKRIASENTKIENSSSDTASTESQVVNAALSSKYTLENATFLDKNGVRIVKDPDDLLVLVNKSRNLSSDWVPKDLVVPNVNFTFNEDSPRKYMRKEAADALEELFKQAKKDNVSLAATSGYRPFEMQKRIFSENVKLYGEQAANKTSAKPGQSEHQTGLSMDITSRSADFKLEESFENTPEGKWLKVNAAKFGFIIRYPKGKENITKYNYEPWHIRYVGIDTAGYIADKEITLEEFFNVLE